MRLLLVRHGQTSANVLNQIDTAAPGADLTDLGRHQAEALPAAIDRVLDGAPLEVIFASTLLRTQQTAAPLAAARGLPVQVRDGLREIQAGSLEMLRHQAAGEQYLGTVLAWAGGDLDRRMPGAESGAEVYARYDAALADVVGTGARTAVVVSHGAIIRSWVAARSRNVTPEVAGAHELRNTGVVVLDGTPQDGWDLVAWEEHAIGGPALDSAHDGPAGEALPVLR